MVWEPVLGTDLFPPRDEVLALLRDPRVEQLYDPGRALSQEMVAAALATPERYPTGGREITAETVVWDVVLRFDGASRWAPGSPPVPTLQGAPVVAQLDEIARALGAP